ncbi:MAG: hypothetical protein KC420_13960, partial [Myxococcales bacterium]|nr:hypothetical protein [Myxococcales bacterium]
DHCLCFASMVQRISLDRVPQSVHVYYPASGQVYYDRLRRASIFHDVSHIEAHPINAPGELFESGELSLRTLPLDHGVDAWGYRLQERGSRTMLPEKLAAAGLRGPAVGELLRDGQVRVGDRIVKVEEVSVERPGQSMAFIMDTRLCDNAFELARGVDLLVCESTYLDEDADKAHANGHMTAREAAILARDAGARRLVPADPGDQGGPPAGILRVLGRVDPGRERADLRVGIGEEREQTLEGGGRRQGVQVVLEEEEGAAAEWHRLLGVAGDVEEPGRIGVERQAVVAEEEGQAIDGCERVLVVIGAPERLDDRRPGAVVEGDHRERGRLVAVLAEGRADLIEEAGAGSRIADPREVLADRRGVDDRRADLDLEFLEGQARAAAWIAVDVEGVVALGHRDVGPGVVRLLVAIDEPLRAPAEARFCESPAARVALGGALEEEHRVVVEGPLALAERSGPRRVAAVGEAELGADLELAEVAGDDLMGDRRAGVVGLVDDPDPDDRVALQRERAEVVVGERRGRGRASGGEDDDDERDEDDEDRAEGRAVSFNPSAVHRPRIRAAGPPRSSR